MVKMPPRPGAPQLLLEKYAEWTARWEAGPLDWATKAAKETLKKGLQPFSHGKCSYCEIRLDWPISVHIEHYIAKTIRTNLAFEWANLFAACTGCNTIKGDYDHGGRLIKPDVEDPEDLLTFNEVTGELEPRPDLSPQQAVRAKATIQICGLTRGDLCQRRLSSFALYKAALAATRKLREEGSLAFASRLEAELLDPEREFKLVLRTMLWLEGFPHLAAEDRRRFGSHP